MPISMSIGPSPTNTLNIMYCDFVHLSLPSLSLFLSLHAAKMAGCI